MKVDNLLQFVTGKRDEYMAKILELTARGDTTTMLTFIAMIGALDVIIPQVEEFQAQFDKQAEQLASIKAAAEPIQEALKRLHPYMDESCVLEIEIPNEDWLTSRGEKWVFLELSIEDDRNGDALRIRHLQALVKALGSEWE